VICIVFTSAPSNTTNFEQLVLATEACTQCGSCAPYLHELLGKKINWTTVEISQIKSVATDIKAFKLIAKNKKSQFDAHQPGQYILVKAYINEQWVTRPYALSAARSTTTYREITPIQWQTIELSSTSPPKKHLYQMNIILIIILR
jgi:glutaredoxin-related protein